MPLRHAQTVIIPPAIEPVSVAEMRAYAKIVDVVADSAIADLIATARAAAELYTGRAFITQTIRMTLLGCSAGRAPWFPGHFQLPVDYFDGAFPDCLALPTEPVQSVTSITTFDGSNVGTIYPPANYGLFGNRIALNAGYYWPSPLRIHSPAEIVYVAGYGDMPQDVPAPIRMAIKIQARGMFDSDSGGKVKMYKAGDGTIEYFEGGGDVSTTVASLLAPYRIIRL
ncbi:head-tail connector protein [Tundrisphaera sp. TA3]|uniref:head-tail connector protein n=1 Tax=Tundrisphaera sp. TA3 TaxID=3435775 RepID=UPI003EB8BDEC